MEEHRALRPILEGVLEETTRTFARTGSSQELVRLARELRARFGEHLAFEERTLFPVLEQADAWGPERVRALSEEHARQRAELDTVIEGIERGWDAQRIALAARSLVTDLLRDMDEEERGPLSAGVLRDDVINVDQATD